MIKKMLINASNPEECRVAVVVDGVLDELDIHVRTYEATLGNIYKGVVSRVEPSLQAVFVDYGAKRNGFLSINDVHPSYFPESFESGRRRPRIQEVFKKDDHVIVQVNKEERQSKGASLTTNISLAGRYLVLMPGTDLYGVSRKIEDEKERKDLKEILKQLKPPEHMGFIIRTAGMGRSKTELARDLNYLLTLWKSIENKVAQAPAPSLLHKEHDIVIRSIREHFSPDIKEILVDDKDVYKKAKDFFHEVMPKYENLVKLCQEKRPLFNKYQLEEQIEQVYSRKVKLKSGGYILIEPTEALVTVDVNSGSATRERDIEETAFRVNMEAAPEIARQLRLRDLGGIIVIDFIDMSQKKHKQDVEKSIRAELKRDRAKTKVLRISALGLLELSRQRLKSSLGTGEYLECPLCDGRGKVRSPETSALSVFRRIKSLLVKGDLHEVRVTAPARVAEYLLNNMRSHLVELENTYGAKISVLVRQAVPDKEILVEAVKEEPPSLPQEQPSQPQSDASVLSKQADIEVLLPDAASSEMQTASVAKTAERRRSRKKPAQPKKTSASAAEDAQESTEASDLGEQALGLLPEGDQSPQPDELPEIEVAAVADAQHSSEPDAPQEVESSEAAATESDPTTLAVQRDYESLGGSAEETDARSSDQPASGQSSEDKRTSTRLKNFLPSDYIPMS
ncbi:MAG: ribonuclease E/G [Desulfomonilaceae bacterium]